MNSEAKILSGIAGEYFVAGELSRRGYISSLTLRNTANIDILTSNGNRTVNIQVKTRCIENTDGWKMGNDPLEDNEMNKATFYVFVEISSSPENKKIKYYVIPKNELNKRVEQNFLDWKSKNKSNGEPKKSNLRIFRIKEYPEFYTEKYENNWNQLF